MVDDPRAAMRMSDDEVDAFLEGGGRVQVATLDAGGQIDVVPMSYLFWNGHLALWTDPASQKIRNLRRNPHIACLVEAGDQFENFRAVQLRGRAEPSSRTSKAPGRLASCSSPGMGQVRSPRRPGRPWGHAPHLTGWWW